MDIDLRRTQTEFAAAFNLTLEEYLMIVRAHNATEVVTVLELMKTKKPRTSYRQFCQTKVRRWLDSQLVGKPLTSQQYTQLKPSYPVTWSLPR